MVSQFNRLSAADKLSSVGFQDYDLTSADGSEIFPADFLNCHIISSYKRDRL
jgi:hypothetical protein